MVGVTWVKAVCVIDLGKKSAIPCTLATSKRRDIEADVGNLGRLETGSKPSINTKKQYILHPQSVRSNPDVWNSMGIVK